MFKITQTDVNAFFADVPAKENQEWSFEVLAIADAHIDNPDSKLDLLKRHLSEAAEKDAMIIFPGDLFCMMQGKFDKRSSKAKVRPEHQTDSYLDDVIEWAAELLKPYQRHIAVIGEGNHETSIKNRHEINPIERLVTLLNVGQKHKVFNGHYGGYIRFRFFRNKIDSPDRVIQSYNLKYIHGWGGGGPISQDLIQESRRRLMYADADIIVSAHTHDAWAVDAVVERFSPTGKIVQCPVLGVKAGTYKDEYKTGKGGWHVETGKPPKPLGGSWIKFYWKRATRRIEIDVTRAK